MDLLLCGAVFSLVFAIFAFTFGRRLERIRQASALRLRADSPLEEKIAIVLATRYRRSESYFRWLGRLQLWIGQSGLRWNALNCVLAAATLFAAGLVAGRIAFGGALATVAAGAAAGAAPALYVHVKRQRRLKAIAQQLPQALDLLKSSLEAGHTLLRGMQVVVEEFKDPLKSELGTVLEHTRIGVALPRALEHLNERVPVDDFRLLTVAVKVQSQVGSSLAEIIGRLSEIVRLRQQLNMQLRALTAQARTGGILVAILPVFMLGAIGFIQPNYTHLLFHDAAGLMLVKIALVMDLAALVIIRRLLRMDF